MLRLTLVTTFALFAFAANSLFARMALGSGDTGPVAFTLIRLWSGAAALYAILAISKGSNETEPSQGWAGAMALFLYALMFSVAYVSLDTGTGALALFATVQLTILGAAAWQGRLARVEVFGAILAFAGFTYLVWPTLGTPSIFGVAAMVLSGVGWGVYTLLGRGAGAPLPLTARNFFRASLVATPLMAAIYLNPSVTLSGAVFAALSGALTSGCGYAIWYSVIPRLSPAVTGVCQLLVPPLAAIMGWVALGEPMGREVLIATILILGGVLVVILGPAIQANRQR
ncbi:MAG: DMT family transporter [Pseudomonadota bacterium]